MTICVSVSLKEMSPMDMTMTMEQLTLDCVRAEHDLVRARCRLELARRELDEANVLHDEARMAVSLAKDAWGAEIKRQVVALAYPVTA